MSPEFDKPVTIILRADGEAFEKVGPFSFSDVQITVDLG